MTKLRYESWLDNVHPRMKSEKLWQFQGYKKALFLFELTWIDCDILFRDFRGKAIAQQLTRSVGSISANMDEGHGRGYGKQRNQFFKIALGSARESKGWYWKSRHLLSKDVINHRLALSDEIIALLVDEISRQNNYQR